MLGKADIYAHSGGQYEWDSCAPVAVARAAGLWTSRLDGTPLVYNNADVFMPDLLICHPVAEAIHIIREVAAEFERPCCCSPAARTPSSCCTSPPRRSGRPHAVPRDARRHRAQLPRGARVPRRHWSPSSACARGRQRAGLDRQRPRATRPADVAQPLQTHAARRHRPSTASTPPSVAAAATRRRPAPRSACLSFRDDFGQWDPKNQRPELWNLYNGAHHKGEHMRVFPLSNWTELDIWRYIEREKHRAARRSTTPTARGLRARRHAARGRSVMQPRPGEPSSRPGGALPHRRRHDLHRRGGVRRHRRRGHRRGRGLPLTERGRHPRRRPDLRGRHGRPQAEGLLLMTSCCASPPPDPSTTASPR
jgi:hypothetical protein